MSDRARRLLLFVLMLCWIPLPALGQLRVSANQMVETWQHEWTRTDFSKKSVDLSEIMSGGPPRDGIPPIDNPKFVAPSEAAQWLDAEEPVLVYRHGGQVKAYPLQILIWHEIANDTVGGKPVVLTFCPLCNSILVFDRNVDGRILDFGTTGKLRNSDLIMWDRQTESWWQQLTGEGIVGTYTGTVLTFLPSALVSFATFRENFPKGMVLSKETGHNRDYGRNPYVGYDNMRNTPFLMRSPVDGRLPAMERVVAVEFGGKARAYPFRELMKAGLVNDTLGGTSYVVIFRKGTRSALDGKRIGDSKDVGTAVVYSRSLDGRRLNFERKGGAVVDRETGSRWNILGRAVAGPLRGKRLKTLVHAQHFAFAWLAFRPQSEIWKAP
ncbi:MAG: DUF3179 domain-containing protein [SAR324 cluster bacterium]|nr:DUF3179 domain-containing protein [SAR324 cluster bacterium]